jgi:transcription initiation factor TFIIIB Brf1 subunit/transcription initiation factor TFIIB
MRKLNLIDQKFTRLTVVLEAGRDKSGHILYHCICDCGEPRIVSGSDLKGDIIQSCGCLAKENLIQRNTTHGMYHSRENGVRKAMIARCTNPNHPDWENYGGRGIKICDRWRYSFENFYTDIGPIPPGMTIDRKDNDGDYEPNNWRFATRKEQANNTRKNHIIKHDNEELTISQWADKKRVSRKTLTCRKQRDWSDERALTTSVQRRKAA